MPVTPEFFSFLVENRLHDSKAWFEAHREDYDRLVLEPLRQLVVEMAPIILTIDPEVVTLPRVGRTISRIFRDTRFSRDKSTFREHLWISFNRGKRERYQSVPELFLDLSPEGCSYGCGWYCPGTERMEALRRLILSGDREVLRTVRAMDRQRRFRMEGELYRRPRYPEAPRELSPWLDRKELYFCRETADPAFLYAPDLGRQVAEELTALAPFYRLLWKAEAASRSSSPARPPEEW